MKFMDISRRIESYTNDGEGKSLPSFNLKNRLIFYLPLKQVHSINVPLEYLELLLSYSLPVSKL